MPLNSFELPQDAFQLIPADPMDEELAQLVAEVTDAARRCGWEGLCAHS